MSKVLVSEFYTHGMKKPIRKYAIHGGTIPPGIMELNGDRYIMPGWYKLPDDEPTPNIEDIAYYPYKAKKPNIPNIDSNKVYKVISSKGEVLEAFHVHVQVMVLEDNADILTK
jgi:hypothetical protein